MKTAKLLSILVLIGLFSVDSFAQFSTSLHSTRNGKNYWYGTANNGFETFTNVPIADIGCNECHGPTDADGNAYTNYSPGCIDCHPSNSGFNPDSLEQAQCLGCHGRQAAEINVHQLADVHRDQGMKCWDCHTDNEMHGDGTEYNSMFEPGAMEADCEDCHIDENSTPPLPNHSAYDPHGGKLHCSTCHASTVISCYNCHFESQVETHLKRAKQQIKNFVLLVNRDRDNKVHTASFQSLSYQGNTFVAYGLFTPHSITSEGRECADCHQNFGGSVPAIEDYNDDGIINFSTWNSADSTLSWLNGVVPMPEDFKRSFKLDYITYNGSTSDPVEPSKNWSFVKDVADGQHMLFATPLSKAQMAKLGFDTLLTSIKTENLGQIPEGYSLGQNYPNPFNPSTTIEFAVPERTHVNITVYNAVGEIVKELVNREMEANTYRINYTAENLSSGVYFYSMQAGETTLTKKFVYMK